MVSKEKYYERKAAGLCTKCGGSREGSSSQVRCLSCQAKIKKTPNNIGGTKESVSASERAEKLKQNTNIYTIEDQKICQRCGDPLSITRICQKCLKNSVFTKHDAIDRYGSRCSICLSVESELKIVSSDISQAMEHKDQELYKIICYRRTPPIEYRVLCHCCYWRENFRYLKQLKTIFDREGVFDESFIDDDDEVLDV